MFVTNLPLISTAVKSFKESVNCNGKTNVIIVTVYLFVSVVNLGNVIAFACRIQPEMCFESGF